MSVSPRARHQEPRSQARAWHVGPALLEWYRYQPGRAPGVAIHAHDDYQLGLPEVMPGLYWYRGMRVPVGRGSISILHPGEAHGSLPREPHTRVATYRMLYIPRTAWATMMQDVREARGLALQSSGRADGRLAGGMEPFFATPVVSDERVVHAFLTLHRAREAGASALAEGVALRALVEALLPHVQDGFLPQGRTTGAGLGRAGRARVLRARDMLLSRLHENILLEELAEEAGLSPFYFAREFKGVVGLSPHRFQLCVRVDRAKRLLLGGCCVDEAARRVGFCDRSHLHAHFARLTGITPGRYHGDRPPEETGAEGGSGEGEASEQEPKR